jgi:ABC-2 type transport system permease protein
MTVIKRRYASFIIYFAVFMVFAVVITALFTDDVRHVFSPMMFNFTVINRDTDSHLTDGLIAYLSRHGNEISLEDDRSALQDASFHRATDYILIVPPGFSGSFIAGSAPTLEIVKTTDTAIGYYADSLVSQYLNQLRLRMAVSADFGEKALVDAVLGDLSLQAPVEKITFGVSAPLDLSYRTYNQMLAYILLVLVILCVTNITMVFRRPDLRMRNLCSPMRPRVFTSQQMLCSMALSVFAWLLMSAIGLAMYGRNLEGVDSRIIALIMLSSLVYTVLAVSIATLSGSFVRSANSQNAAANMMTLVLCFLGGVFVPLEMFGDSLLAVARFLPTYWYITAIDSISALTSFDAAALQPVWQSLVILLVFAAAIFCVTLVIDKYQSRSERFLSSVKTELEA